MLVLIRSFLFLFLSLFLPFFLSRSPIDCIFEFKIITLFSLFSLFSLFLSFSLSLFLSFSLSLFLYIFFILILLSIILSFTFVHHSVNFLHYFFVSFYPISNELEIQLPFKLSFFPSLSLSHYLFLTSFLPLSFLPLFSFITLLFEY